MTEPCDLGDPRVPRGPDPSAQSCATCKWGVFQMTNHTPPRINPKKYGRCDWPVPEVIPMARCYGLRLSKLYPSVIWAKDTGCPVWEGKQ